MYACIYVHAAAFRMFSCFLMLQAPLDKILKSKESPRYNRPPPGTVPENNKLYLSIYIYVYLSIDRPVYLSMYVSIYPSIFLSSYLSIYLPINQSIL